MTIFFNNDIDLTGAISVNDISDTAQSFTRTVEDIILNYKIDIICAENLPIGLPPAYNILLNMIAVQHKIPIVLQMHSFASKEIQTELINQLMWNKISCVSKSVTGDCFRKGANIDTLSTDYLGVDNNIFQPKTSAKCLLKEQLGISNTDKIVLTATRIIQGRRGILQEKGLIDLIQAFSRVSSRHDNLKLVIATGKAPHRLDKEFEQSKEMLLGYIKLHNIESKTIVKTYIENQTFLYLHQKTRPLVRFLSKP